MEDPPGGYTFTKDVTAEFDRQLNGRECATCKGARKVACTTCKGTGKVLGFLGELKRKCATCGASGKVPCEACEGHGWIL